MKISKVKAETEHRLRHWNSIFCYQLDSGYSISEDACRLCVFTLYLLIHDMEWNKKSRSGILRLWRFKLICDSLWWAPQSGCLEGWSISYKQSCELIRLPRYWRMCTNQHSGESSSKTTPSGHRLDSESRACSAQSEVSLRIKRNITLWNVTFPDWETTKLMYQCAHWAM